jgi:drug/metabolite transporter (DMT)-like permease
MHFGPALRVVLGIALLSVMDAIIKGLAAEYPVLQVAFMRFAAGTIVSLTLLAFMRPGLPSRETVIANGFRSVIAVMTATSFFYALSQLPLAETLLLSFLAPMFVALFGVLMLGERVSGRVLLAIGLGFLGTAVVVAGQVGDAGSATRSWTGIAAALFSAVVYALNLVLLRARAQKDAFIFIVSFQNVGPALLISPFAAYVWLPPEVPHLIWFLALGCLGVSGHILMATAFARAEAARLASLEYTALIWAVLLGFFFFGEVPSWQSAAGAVLIVGAALMASRR